MKKKILSILLAAIMLLTTQGIPTLAGSVTGGNEVDGTGAAVPANPVHHCTKKNDGSDNTDWSYVYFGSYPQTEVTGDALTAAITGANYDSNGDAWVNGTKYRRISKSDTNYDAYFGSSDYRYFKWERIKWRVLENNGRTLFVVADQGLDCKDYHDPGTSITWENCTLRTWLNGTFYNTAFSSSEQGAIVQQTVVNDNNLSYGTSGGNNTQDNVYLLSIAEVINPAYGFCESYSTYSASRLMQVSDYAHIMGVGMGSNIEGKCWWWLRSPGYNIYDAAFIHDYGCVSRNGYDVGYSGAAAMPALQIKLDSGLWYTSDDGTSGEGGSMDQTAPKETTLKGKITAKSKAFTVRWKKAESVTGYQIQYSTSKKFTNKKTNIKTVKKASKTKLTIKKLKAAKKYYVRIRTYQTVGGKKYYSGWSKAKSVKTKK